MTNKQHIIIIFAMVIAVSLLWRLIVEVTKEEEIIVEQRTTPYNIEIISASLGLNCRSYQSGGGAASGGGFLEERRNPIRKDNALRAVSDICNGKEKCRVPVSNALVGSNLDRYCSYARLEVEYRCFSFDRPWKVSSYPGGELVIDCSTR